MTSTRDAQDPLELYDELLQEGRAPDPATFAARYPEHPELRREIEALDALRSDLDHAGRWLRGEDRPLPEAIAGYRLGCLLGRGGMGVVFEAEAGAGGRRAAVKLLRYDDPLSLQRFRREAELTRALEHPGIAVVYDSGVEDAQAYLITELLPGSSLRALMDEQPPTLAVAGSLGLQVAEALAYAHSRGIVHRDVKPSNIIVQPDGTAKLIDFGVAVRAQSQGKRITRTGVFVGSHNYAAPEQLRGEKKNVGPWTDTYALAVTLFEMLAGRTPFVCATLAARLACADRRPPDGPRHYNGSVPRALDKLILRALAPKPRQRFQDGSALTRALGDCLKRCSLGDGGA